MNNDDTELKWGNSLSIGIQYKRILLPNLIFSARTFFDSKLILDYEEGGPGGALTNDRFSVGATIGVEWLFMKNLPYFNQL